MVSCPVLAFSNSFAPPSGKTLAFVGQDRDTIIRYVSTTGNIPGGTMSYTSIQKMEGLDAANEYGSGPQDAESLLLAYPDSVIQIGLYMVDGLNKTIVGRYNVHLKKLAQWIKNAHRPVYLRIGYEFDNPSNHYDPQQYIQAFRYVVDFLRKEGVTNAAYVWHSYCWTQQVQGQWMAWYPGDDYVDWFGASLFATPDQLWTVSAFVKLSRVHHKPFMICESTPWGMYTSRAKIDFLNHVFKLIDDQNIEAFCYIDSNWDLMPMYKNQNIGDARIEKDPDIKDFWLKEINQSRYLKASPELFQSLGYSSF